MVHFKGILTIYVESSVTTARISPRDNDLGPISESDRARAEAALRRRNREEGRRVSSMRRGLLHDESVLGLYYFYNYIIILSLCQILFSKSLPDSIHSRNTSSAARHDLITGWFGHVVHLSHPNRRRPIWNSTRRWRASAAKRSSGSPSPSIRSRLSRKCDGGENNPLEKKFKNRFSVNWNSYFWDQYRSQK